MTGRLKSIPRDFESLYSRGHVHDSMGNNTKAAEDFGRAFEINPEFTKALFARATEFQKLGRFAEAKADFEAVIKKDPDSELAKTAKQVLKANEDKMG